MLLNCDAGKDYCKSLGQKEDQTSQSFFFFFKFYFIFKLYIIVLVLPNIKMNHQPWIFTGRTGAEAETPVFWSSDVTRHSLEKSLMLGKIEDRRRSLLQSMRQLDCITDAMNMNLGKSGRWWGTGRPGMLQFMGLQRVGHD